MVLELQEEARGGHGVGGFGSSGPEKVQRCWNEREAPRDECTQGAQGLHGGVGQASAVCLLEGCSWDLPSWGRGRGPGVGWVEGQEDEEKLLSGRAY